MCIMGSTMLGFSMKNDIIIYGVADLRNPNYVQRVLLCLYSFKTSCF